MTRIAAGGGDIFSIVAVNAFGGVGVAVSLFDFLVVQRNPILGLDPFGVVVLLLGNMLCLSASATPLVDFPANNREGLEPVRVRVPSGPQF